MYPIIAVLCQVVHAGDVSYSHRWKDPENVFRKHPKLLLTGVPTLMQWETVSTVVKYLLSALV